MTHLLVLNSNYHLREQQKSARIMQNEMSRVLLCALFVCLAQRALSLTRHGPTRPRVSTMRDMFSGIVEEIGEITLVEAKKEMKLWDGSLAEGYELVIKGTKILEDAYIGCSISVNGVCLTATELSSGTFTVGLAPETLRKTNLRNVRAGTRVNLERALKADGRNSGHVVQGHVDSTGRIVEKWNEGDSLWVKVKVPDSLIKFIVPKGFIAVDGTSLTICDVNVAESWFTFMLVMHTQQNVIIPGKAIGDDVNIEVDVLSKMVDQSLRAMDLEGKLDIANKRIEKLEELVGKMIMQISGGSG